MHIKVGIIIPAYNVEDYIFRAIESCIHQTYSNIEIIVVDDGSSDGTYSVVEEYRKKDSRIKLYYQENGGVSSARNRGLDACTSDYVIFLDSDDWMELDAIEKCLQRLKDAEGEQCLISFGYRLVQIGTDGLLYNNADKSEENDVTMPSEEALIYAAQQKYCLGCLWCKIFSMTAINKSNLRFCRDISYGEDGLFVFEYLKKADKFIYIADSVWNTLERPGSAVRSPYKRGRMSSITAVEKMLAYHNSAELRCELKKALVVRTLGVLHKALIADPLPREDITLMRENLRRNFWEYMAQEKRAHLRLCCIFGAFCPCGLARKMLIRHYKK